MEILLVAALAYFLIPNKSTIVFSTQQAPAKVLTYTATPTTKPVLAQYQSLAVQSTQPIKQTTEKQVLHSYPYLSLYSHRLLSTTETEKLTSAFQKSFDHSKYPFEIAFPLCVVLAGMFQLPKNYSVFWVPKSKTNSEPAKSTFMSLLVSITALNNPDDRAKWYWQPCIVRAEQSNFFEKGIDALGSATRVIVTKTLGKVLKELGIGIDNWTNEKKEQAVTVINNGVQTLDNELGKVI